jgi:tetratricopeptide (TPR) repeat protein
MSKLCRSLPLSVFFFLASVTLLAQGPSSWEELTAAGSAAFSNKQFAAAEKHFAGAVRAAGKLGKADIRLATSLGNLASALEAKGDRSSLIRATKLYRRALDVCERANAPEADRLRYSRLLAGGLWREGRFEEAAEYWEVLAQAEEKNPFTAGAAAAGFAESLSERYALVSRRSVVTGTAVSQDPGGWPTGPVAGRSAQRAMEETSTASGQRSVPNPADVASASRANVSGFPNGISYQYQVRTFSAKGPLLDIAVSFRERGVRIRERIAPGNPETLSSKLVLANLYLAQKRFNVAREHYASVVALFEVAPPADRRQQVWALAQLATTQFELHQPEAEGHFKRAIGVAEDAFGADGADVVQPLLAYAEALRSGKRKAEAEKLEQRAKQIQEKERTARNAGTTPK